MNIYSGIPGAPGISKGTIFYLRKNNSTELKITIDEAIVKAKDKINEIYIKAKETTNSDNAKIFEAYQMLLEDAAFISPIIDSVNSGNPADEAVLSHTDKMSKLFETHKSEYMKQRADDIRYIGNLLIDCLKGNEYDFSFPENKKLILVAEELTPTDTIQMDKTNIVGFATAKGGATSHTVILAKSLGIPAIVGINEIGSLIDENDAIIDATSGKLIVNPDADTTIYYNELIRKEQQYKNKLKNISDTDIKTTDGKKVFVYGNIGSAEDLSSESAENIDGIGLFRSEFLYSSTTIKPSLEEQISSYKQVIEKLYPKTVTIRTLDIGGDKKLEYMNMPQEENPFLGNRGIRLCLLNLDIFKQQLEAILIASANKTVKIMFPMITTVEEILSGIAILNEVRDKLKKSKTEYCRNISVGIMIETPASAINADKLGKYCDFFSIGTNDLIQYVTASDRGNDFVSKLYTPYNPAVLKLIYHVINSAAENNVEVSMCGDIASNEHLTGLLLGLGLRKFSVPLPLVNKIKYTVTQIDSSKAQKLAQDALKLDREDDIINLVKNFNAELNL